MRILVAKLREHGDVLLSGPVFRALRRHYPKAHIDAYLYEETIPMLAGHPGVNGFISCKRKDRGPLANLKTLWKIRQKRYDMVINLTEGDRGALAALVSPATVKVGFDPESSGMMGKRHIYTHVIRHCPRPRHRVERDLDAVRMLGIDPCEEDKALFFHCAPERMVDGPYVVIHPLSRCPYKCLQPRVWKEVIKRLIAQGKRVVVTGGPAEDLSGILTGGEVNLAGKLSLPQLGAVLRDADHLYTVDSMPMHLASALQVPLTVVFGPSSEINWGPYRHPKAQIVTLPLSCRPCYQAGCGGSGLSDCLLRITPEQILT